MKDLLHSKLQKMRHSTPALPLFVLSRQPAVLDLSFNVLNRECLRAFQAIDNQSRIVSKFMFMHNTDVNIRLNVF